MYTDRIEILKKIEQRRNSKAILYVTGDRPGLETQIHQEVYDFFVNILDNIGIVERISLILYTRGGNTLAAWSIVNLIRQFCEHFEVIIPNTTNSLDGSFAHLKGLIQIHRGLKADLKRKLILSILQNKHRKK